MMGGLDGAEILRTVLRVAPNVRPIAISSRTSTSIAGMGKTTKRPVWVNLDTMMGGLD